jgi:hypothetical protein
METGGKRFVALAVLVALLQGCATQLSSGPEALLQFQTNSIAPAAVVEAAALQAGDILLTTDPTLTSASIRLMTFAPVSHAAVYIGDGQVVEALGSGVRVRDFEELQAEATVVLVLRYPELTAEQATLIREYAVSKWGTRFSFLAITLHIPFSIGRRVCELPLVSPALRDGCIRGLGVLHRLAASESRLFCSQLVLQAYRVPMATARRSRLLPATRPRRGAHRRGAGALAPAQRKKLQRRAGTVMTWVPGLGQAWVVISW